MEQFFENLLNKPESFRRKIAFITTGFIGIAIFATWLIITSQSIKQTAKEIQNPDNVASKKPATPSSINQETVKTEISPEKDQSDSQDNTDQSGQNNTFDTLLKKNNNTPTNSLPK